MDSESRGPRHVAASGHRCYQASSPRSSSLHPQSAPCFNGRQEWRCGGPITTGRKPADVCTAFAPRSAAVHRILECLARGELDRLRGRIWISAPVAGLRPTRAARAPVENEPNPTSCTVPPFVTSPVMAVISASSVSPVIALLSPVACATASTQLLLVHDIFFLE